MAEPDRHIYTEAKITAYEGYMPDDWGEKTFKPIPEGIVLERLMLDLALSWRTTSYTAQMPATSIRAMHAAAVGRANFVSPDSSIVAYSERIIGQLVQRVPEMAENSVLRDRLVSELATISAEFRDRAAAVKRDYPIEPIWAQFMQETPFRLSLWASQRVAYVAFYNAYEAFVVDCLKVGTGLTSLRSTDKKSFNNALRTGLSKDIADPCWFHGEINIDRIAAKLVAGESDWLAVNKQFVGALLKALSTPCGVNCPTFLRFFPQEARGDGKYPAAMAERYAASACKLRREARAAG